MNHHMLTFLVFLVSSLLYGVGFTLSSLLFLTVAAAFELWFWYRLLDLKGKDSDNDSG